MTGNPTTGGLRTVLVVNCLRLIGQTMNKYQLIKLRNEKRAAAQKLVDACAKGSEIRDMSPDEKTQFDALMADVATIKTQLSNLEAVEADEDEPVEPRSTRTSKPIGDAPAVHTRTHGYSILRALRSQVEGKGLDGVEGEISQDIAKRSGKSPQGFYLPLGNEEEYRDMLYPKGELRTDLTTSTGTGAVFVVPNLPFIELLRNKMLVKQLGAKFLTGLTGGKFAIPRQSGGATASWLAESGSATATAQTLDQVALSDRTLLALTNISRKFLYQSSVDAEAFVKDDLAQVLAVELDRAAIAGTGSSNQPFGITTNSTITTNSAGVQGGTNGLAPTFAQMVAMESQVASYNADRGAMAYLTSPAARGKLKGTVKVGTFPVFIWDNDEVNGYPAYASSNVPSNLTKGTSSGVCSAAIFGNWNDLIVAQWGGIDVVVNPYSGQGAGTITISMATEADIAVRHPESFSVVLDMLTV